MGSLVKQSTRRATDVSETAKITETWYGRHKRVISVQQRLRAFRPKKKYAVIRGRLDPRSAKAYYLCTVVLFNIPKDPDIINSHELLIGDVIDQ